LLAKEFIRHARSGSAGFALGSIRMPTGSVYSTSKSIL